MGRRDDLRSNWRENLLVRRSTGGRGPTPTARVLRHPASGQDDDVGPGWGRETPVRSLIEESPITYIKDIMKLSYFYPLLGFVVLTVAIGFGLVIPRSCIAGINDLTIGFAMTIAGACLIPSLICCMTD
jgi:hypothetical protein